MYSPFFVVSKGDYLPLIPRIFTTCLDRRRWSPYYCHLERSKMCSFVHSRVMYHRIQANCFSRIASRTECDSLFCCYRYRIEHGPPSSLPIFRLLFRVNHCCLIYFTLPRPQRPSFWGRSVESESASQGREDKMHFLRRRKCWCFSSRIIVLASKFELFSINQQIQFPMWITNGSLNKFYHIKISAPARSVVMDAPFCFIRMIHQSYHKWHCSDPYR